MQKLINICIIKINIIRLIMYYMFILNFFEYMNTNNTL
jgi:hypothetical protein